MQLLNQEAIKLHAPVLDHAWSPTDPILACYVPEHDQIPARVILKEMPSKNLLAQQSFVNVVGVCFYDFPLFVSSSFLSAASIGKKQEISSESKLTAIRNPRSRFSLNSNFSMFAKRVFLSLA